MNAYAEMKKRHQEEVNALPMYWAFSDEQFDQQLKKLGLTRNDTGKLCKTFGGGFCLASDAQMIADTLRGHRREMLENQAYIILGVMHSVDKWLDGKGLEQDEVNRAATMREKTLCIIESRPEQIHAHLVIDWLGDTHCSNCGEDVNCTEPFCQHCGARLDEPEVKEY